MTRETADLPLSRVTGEVFMYEGNIFVPPQYAEITDMLNKMQNKILSHPRL